MSMSWEEYGINNKKNWDDSGDDKIKTKENIKCNHCGNIVPVGTTHIPTDTILNFKVCLAL